MNFFASQNPKSWCTQRIVVAKFEMEDEELVGTEAKRHGTDRTETATLKSRKSEVKRLTELKTLSGIELEEHGIRGIEGLATGLKVWSGEHGIVGHGSCSDLMRNSNFNKNASPTCFVVSKNFQQRGHKR